MISRKEERISIKGSRFLILPKVVPWRCALVRTRGWQTCAIGHGLFGCSAIPRPRERTSTEALQDARESGQAVSLLWALGGSLFVDILCGNYRTANARADEFIALSDEKDSAYWRTFGMLQRGRLLGLTGRASDAVQMISSSLTTSRSIGTILLDPTWLSSLASAYANTGQFVDAWRCIGEAMTAIKTTGERWFEAEVNRIAGEIALKSPEPDAAKAQANFEGALAVARQQQAKSWELRAAMSPRAALARSGQAE